MDFLRNLALPQSIQHINLLHFILVLVYLLFIPYLSLLVGSSLISLWFNVKGQKLKNSYYQRFAKDVIDIVIVNKNVLLVLGIIPIISSVMIFAQLLQGTEAITVGVLTFSVLLFVFAVISLYNYKFTFSIRRIFESVESSLSINDVTDKVKHDFPQSGLPLTDAIATGGAFAKEFVRSNLTNHIRSGYYSVILLLSSLFIFIGGNFIAVDSSNWNSFSSIFQIFISFEVWIRFLWFLTLSIAFTCITILFFFFSWNGGKKETDSNYQDFVKSWNLPAVMVFGLVQPLFILFDLFALPHSALSFPVFGFSVFGILVMFIALHFIYVMIKEIHFKFTPLDSSPRLDSKYLTGFTATVFYLFVAFIVLLVVKDGISVSNSTKPQSIKLAAQYETYKNGLENKLGVSTMTLSGEDIFVGKCSACHKFDAKLVGPAYNLVLPKYVGKRDQLVKFILSPSKVDPNFPPMPAQGLRPNEAEVVADYLLKVFREKK